MIKNKFPEHYGIVVREWGLVKKEIEGIEVAVLAATGKPVKPVTEQGDKPIQEVVLVCVSTEELLTDLHKELGEYLQDIQDQAKKELEH